MAPGSPASSSSFDSDLDDDSYDTGSINTEEQNEILAVICQSNEKPYDYDLHLTAIGKLAINPIYKTQLEQQFERFSAVYPLTIDLWLQYLELNPSKLEEAFKDYLQPELYYKFVDDIDDPEVEKKWTIVLQALGSHWNESEKVYGLYRTFLKDSINDIETQTTRVRSSYRAQLANPYFDGSERVLSEYRAWSQYQNFTDNITGELQSIEKLIRGQRSPLRRMQELEHQISKISTHDSESLQNAWLEYSTFSVRHVKTIGCAITLTTFERAVSAVCLSSLLWSRYIDFAESMNLDILPIAKRAIRNVPFEPSVWVAYIVQLELKGEVPNEILNSLTDLCTRKPCPMLHEPLLQVILAFCDALRRSGRKDLLSKAFTVAKISLQDWRYGVDILLMYEAKSMYAPEIPETSSISPKWRELWDQVLNSQGNSLTTYQSCIFECIRSGGSVSDVRELYKRGIAQVEDYPSVLAEAWLVFEREFGNDLLEYQHAKKSVSKMTISSSINQAQAPVEELAKEEKPVERKKTPKEPTLKRKQTDQIDIRKEEYKKQRINDEKNQNTIFLCELNKATTKEELMELFAKCGKVKDVRLVIRNRESNVSRGMAYVEFEEETGAQNALKLDKTDFKGAALNIQQSKPTVEKPKKITEKDSVWKACADTLYVTGLNDKVTEQVLIDVFSKFGVIKAQLIMGKLKNKLYGLIQYEKEESILKAIESNEPIQYDTCHYQVKRSRFNIKEIQEQQAKSKNASNSEKGLNSRKKNSKNPSQEVKKQLPTPRLSMKPIVPRSLKIITEKPQVNKAKDIIDHQPAEGIQPGEAMQKPQANMKSNKDFRKLFY